MPRERSRRPNVVLIMTDDQGHGDFGFTGNPYLRTPRLDGLAQSGVRLTRFYVSPVCTPTRASLMTGRYNFRTRAIDTYLGRAMMDPEEVTLAQMLARAGYRTGIFGKWHLGDNYPLRACDRGFHESLTHRGGGLAQAADRPPGSSYFDPLLERNGKPVRARGYCSDVFTDAAIRFVQRNRNRPFFCHLAFNAPHVPLQIDEKYAAPYRAAGLNDTTARLYGMVANLDENIGRLLDALTLLGLERNTILVFLSDNGAQHPDRYNAGLRATKGTVYEGGIRVPCILRWPGRWEGGSLNDALAAHIDLVPTLLQACGVSPPRDVALDGTSLAPLLDGAAAPSADRLLFIQWHRGDAPEPYNNCAVIGRRWKLINGRELYDVEADPAESREVSRDHPALVRRLREEYEKWLADVSATRGYDPPRIVVGSPHENPSLLTRQDWRGPRASWAETGLGHWELEFATGGMYRVEALFPPLKTGARVSLLVGEQAHQRMARSGWGRVVFASVRLPAGPARLEVRIHEGETVHGPHYVSVRLLDEYPFRQEQMPTSNTRRQPAWP